MPLRVTTAAGRFVLGLDKQPAVLKDCEGGNIKGDVVTTIDGSIARKQISTIIFEPFTISVGMSMGKPLAEWIRATLEHAYMRKNGYVAATDIQGKAQSYRNFRGALIEEISIPAMDGSSKEAAFFTIKFAPEEITYAKGDDAVAQAPVNIKQKQWLSSNFRLRIGELPCSRVSKVDRLTIKQGVVRDSIGESRIPLKEPTTLEFPNLKVTFSAADAGPWQDWFADFVVKGNNAQDKELQGVLEFLDSSLNEVLGSIDLLQVGIFALYPEKIAAGTDTGARFVAELYVEQMAINLKDVQ